MAIELALALTAIASKAIVADLIAGQPMTRSGWADIAGQVVNTVITTGARQESGMAQLGQQFDRLSGQVDQVSRQINEIPMREFDQHMAAGRRYLRDLPAAWRTDRDRRDLIHDARAQFVSAVAIAELGKDLRRQALAEVAIAGCWLWVPSIEDVRNAAGQSRQLLEQEMLFGAYAGPGAAPPIGDYNDIVKLCKAYGERSEYVALLAQPSPSGRLTVRPALDRWVECADIWVHITRDKQQPAAKPQPAVTAKPVLQPIALSGRANLRGWDVGVQPIFGQSPVASQVPSEPPTVFIVTVRNSRAARVRVSVSPSIVQVAIANVPTTFSINASWTEVPPGETIARRVSVPAAAGAGTNTDLAPFAAGTQLASFARGRALMPASRDRGVVAFRYPAAKTS